MPEIRMSQLVGTGGTALRHFLVDFNNWTFNTVQQIGINGMNEVVGKTLHSIVLTAVCKITEHGYSVGEMASISSPYPIDGGRTPGHGPSVSLNKTAYDGFSNIISLSTTEKIAVVPKTGGGPAWITSANWTIRAIVFYS